MPAIRQEVATLKGELVEYRVRNADGWGTGEVRPAGSKSGLENVPIVGKIVGARVGDTVELSGAWAEHPRFGRQFKVRSCNASRPDDSEGVVKWLASRLPDVGATRARELVERFGAQLWSTIEKNHDVLTSVAGITPERARAIHHAYLAHQSERDSMIALRGWGLTDGQVARCLSQWETLTMVVHKIRENPYALASCVHGFGFKRADLVGSKMGIAHDSPFRIQAGVEHVLSCAVEEGHCYMPGKTLQEKACADLGVSPGEVAKAIVALAKAGRVVRREWRVYLARMDVAEQACADGLLALLKEGA
jgi:exodeoxyribonuclease V alpha subunit